ncbi:replicative DNA helicase [Zavarzinia compransoris]|uniref:Replicative DNA helicase n=1 Tax=Zavarzinia compransoris TaxID=1264899 RepID=A0A317E0T2_9PROT|nr:replicative DNA helicase [Zavarzinia compransoris]PWR20054.1 replicative DNA helicase [Zavarzinia compransoris]TDP44825.1 replicative DNA helicase [Zavarzinia compransoris]
MDTLRPLAAPAVASNDAGTGPHYRTPPHNLEAEQALLGAILVNNEAVSRVNEFLLADHFYEPLHQRIYTNSVKLIEKQQIANPVTLRPFFEQDPAIAEIGGPSYLARLAANAVTVINAGDYGRAIYDLALKRELIQVGEDIVNGAYEPDIDNTAEDLIQAAEGKLFTLAESGSREGGLMPFAHGLTAAIQAAERAFKSDGKLTGVTTGLIDLDQKLGGLHRSDLLILAGRPSMGKTALATNIAFNAARAARFERDAQGRMQTAEGAVVAFFSLEMSAEQLAMRMLSEQSRIVSEKIRRGQMNTDEFHHLVQAAQEVQRLPLYIDDTPGITISALRTRCRRLKRQSGLGLVIVDYLQLLNPSGKSRTDNRVGELSEITRGLKMLAKELDVPVVALSQLSRQVENREDKRPQLADLRESGTIEQDADVVMFVFREEYYLMRREPREGTPEHAAWQDEMEKVHNLAEVIIGKQRHGSIGIVKLRFDPSLTLFQNLAREEYLSNADDY